MVVNDDAPSRRRRPDNVCATGATPQGACPIGAAVAPEMCAQGTAEPDQSDFFFGLEVAGSSIPQPPSLFGMQSMYCRLPPVYASVFLPMRRDPQGSIKTLPVRMQRVVYKK